MISDDFFKQLSMHFSNALPFVVYKKPNDTMMNALLQKDDTVYTIKTFSESGFVFAPFNDREKTVLMSLEHCEKINSMFVNSMTNQTSHKNSLSSKSDKQQHLGMVQNAIDEISSGTLQKVVLSRCETVHLKEQNPIQIFKRLLSHNNTAFVYCWYHPKVGLWLGATPETLVSTEGKRFKTMSLAGTQKKETNTDVLWTSKEKNEQQIVTDAIANSLKPLVETISISKPETVSAGHVLHLRSQISGTLKRGTSDFSKLVTNLHPTPAVCGFPKQKAKDFILKNEAYDREFYTGYLGELNMKQIQNRNTNKRNVENSAYGVVRTMSNLFVNLRCMQLRENEAMIYVGGGITKDSNPEHEWVETVSKTMTIKKALS